MRRAHRRLAVAVAFAALAATLGAVLVNERSRQRPARDAAGALRDASVTTQSSLCTAANAVGVGLQGTYFEGERWGGRALFERLDAVIDFARGFAQAPTGEGAAASVRWKGWIKAPLNGKFRFHATVPGMSIRVANRPAAGEGVPEGTVFEMAAGRFYPIQIELERTAAVADALRLEWTAPHGARYVVPKALLFPPTDSVGSIRS